jgi:hypothetical protein
VPLSALAYLAANAHAFLARRADVRADRIGIVGHSFGGKWALFASCLYERFACAVWSDPGIVFDERNRRKQNPNGSVNYWVVWYLGFDLGKVADPKNAGTFRKLDWLLDNTGPIARNVTDVAIALSVMAGEDPLDARTAGSAAKMQPPPYVQYLKADALKGKRLGVPVLDLSRSKQKGETKPLCARPPMVEICQVVQQSSRKKRKC